MSHFTVLVTNTDEQSIESQLEPFYEQGEDGDYFMERQIEVPYDKVKEEAKKIVDNYKKDHNKAVKKRREAKRRFKENEDWANDKMLEMQLERDAKYDNHYLVSHLKAKEAYDKGEYTEIVKEWYGGNVDRRGNIYYVYNPNAKWDWWEIGGRWSGYLKLKDNAKSEVVVTQHWGQKEGHAEELKAEQRTDVARVEDVDWERMKLDKLRQAEKWWEEYQERKKKKEDFSPYFEYGIEKGMTKNQYVKKQCSPATFAVLHEGEWYERGSMGWWAIVSDEKPSEDWDDIFNSIISKLDPKAEITVVDCHI